MEELRRDVFIRPLLVEVATPCNTPHEVVEGGGAKLGAPPAPDRGHAPRSRESTAISFQISFEI